MRTANRPSLVSNLQVKDVRMGYIPLNYNSIPNLKFAMHFDNNAAIGESSTLAVNSSTIANNGTMNEITPSTDGWSLGAAQFSAEGDSYITLDNLISLSGDFTFSIWFYLGVMTDRTIVANSGSVDGFIIIRTDTTIGVNLGNPPGTEEIFTVQQLFINNWYHLTVTRTAGEVRLYIDNIESSTGAITNTGTFEFDLIGTSNDHTLKFDGSLDEMAVWDRSLGVSELDTIQQKASVQEERRLSIGAGIGSYTGNLVAQTEANLGLLPQNTIRFPALPNPTSSFCQLANLFSAGVGAWNGGLSYVSPGIWIPPFVLAAGYSWNDRRITSPNAAISITFDSGKRHWIFKIRPMCIINPSTSADQYWIKLTGDTPIGTYLQYDGCNLHSANLIIVRAA